MMIHTMGSSSTNGSNQSNNAGIRSISVYVDGILSRDQLYVFGYLPQTKNDIDRKPFLHLPQ